MTSAVDETRRHQYTETTEWPTILGDLALEGGGMDFHCCSRDPPTALAVYNSCRYNARRNSQTYWGVHPLQDKKGVYLRTLGLCHWEAVRSIDTLQLTSYRHLMSWYVPTFLPHFDFYIYKFH